MKHHFLDHHWKIESPIHKFDPRIKIIISFLLLFAVVLTPNGRFTDYIFFVPMILALLYISKLPIISILKRMAVALPIVVIIAISLPFLAKNRIEGIENFISVIIKAISAIWIMTLLTATTRFRDLVAGMQKLHFPTIFTSIMGFMYRYIFLLIDEAEHLNIGRRSRSFGNKSYLAMKGFGWMISSLFIRSFERGERIYHTMCSRGYSGEYKTMTEMKITTKEVGICAMSIGLIVVIKIIAKY
jgi:cobalt/nickel transport system permease protein